MNAVDLEERGSGVRTGSVDSDAVEIDRQRGKMKRNVLQVHLGAQSLTALPFCRSNELAVERFAVHEHGEEHHGQHKECGRAEPEPCEHPQPTWID